VIVSPPELCMMIRRLEVQNTNIATEAAAAAELSFTQIQRVPDVLQIEARRVTPVGPSLAIQIGKGKVTARTGAMTVHVSSTSALAEKIRVIQRRKTEDELLFDKGAGQLLSMVIPPGRDVRALRKGGAIAASLNGLEDDQLQLQMRHTTRARTLKYLGHGMYNGTDIARGLRVQQLLQVTDRLSVAASKMTSGGSGTRT
jgi:hypothetical protein